MSSFELTVVISTFNRPELLSRAVDSVVKERRANRPIHIIVVDDASTIPLPRIETSDLRIFHMEKNGGPGPARMRGIEAAQTTWVLILDDDDMLRVGAIDFLESYMSGEEHTHFPVFQFAVNVQDSESTKLTVGFQEYASKTVTGDFTPVLHRENFLKAGISYPKNRAGGEHLLWWKLAEIYGIPTIQKSLIICSDDAPNRLTDFESQITNATAHLELAELTLVNFGKKLRSNFPGEYRRIRLGYFTYALLVSEREKARKALSDMPVWGILKVSLWLVTWMPLRLVRFCFLCYRESRR